MRVTPVSAEDAHPARVTALRHAEAAAEWIAEPSNGRTTLAVTCASRVDLCGGTTPRIELR